MEKIIVDLNGENLKLKEEIRKSKDLRRYNIMEKTDQIFGEEMENENLKVSQKRMKQHSLFCTLIETGLSQLVNDEDPPVAIVGSLKARKH